MGIIDKVRIWGNQYFLAKALLNRVNQPIVTNYQSAKYIGILFEAFSADQIATVKEYAQDLRKAGKNVEMIGLFKSKKDIGENVFEHFTMADVNWFQVPRQGIIDAFAVKPFDLLISLHNDTSLPLEYISAVSQAKFRVGRYLPQKTYCYDLMAYTNKDTTLRELIKQIDKLLTEINQHATI